MTDTLTALLQKLDENRPRYSDLERYYTGRQPLSFLAPEAREALGSRFARMSSNLPRLAITALSERLRVTGFNGVDVYQDWLRCDLDELSRTAHREALLLGQSYLICWTDAYGRPLVTVESAHQMTALRDPGSRRLTHAIKRWETATTTEAVLYGPEVITRYRANQTGATTAGFKVVDEIANPLGVVPVVRLLNSDRILDEGVSEIDDMIPLVDALNKLLADMLVSSENAARPRRWASGIELEEIPILDDDGEETGETTSVNPFPENDKMMISENDSSRFGSIDAADLAGYERAVDVITQQISAVSALPASMLGITHSNPSSADAIRAAEAGLTARAEARQAQFGRSWEDLARLIVGVRDGADPLQVDVRVEWADPSTRSVAQEADAVTKLFAAGLLPASYALKRLGYSDDEVAEIRTARRAEALDAQAIDLTRLVG
ncbi:phage portal protein [[Mycobacterium] burgundiense]|uniref:Phage portal protein n=1 Tax=[Mycobacterium] burgundiense TaxID=3064286 RepID=A0ABM9LW03_9MYCO|nr:phage portal protein [Mycolicibacterium sp. MU0053]CAJ1505672.1 phage portal protein [Mycolicibacterium sp. MU0053]